MKLSLALLSSAATTALAVALLPATPTVAQEAAQPTHRYVVVRDGAQGGGNAPEVSVASLARRAGGSQVQALDNIGAAIVDLTAAEAAELAQRPGLLVARDGRISIADRDWDVRGRTHRIAQGGTAAEAGVARIARSWGLDRIDQRRLPLNGRYNHRPQVDGSRVHAFVFDTGLNTSHPEFSGRVGWGYDGIGDGNGVQDCHGHGSHVAGTVASSIFGVAPRAIVHPIRVLDCSGSGSFSVFMSALSYVAGRAPVNSVGNASLSGPIDYPFNPVVNAAADNFVRTGTPLVVAAGNENQDASRYAPAGATLVTTVAATNKRDQHASYSNWGATRVDLYAPGSSINSTWYQDPDFYLILSGTSMAAPHVAGFMALYLELRPDVSPGTLHASAVTQSTKNVVSTRNGTPNRLAYMYGLAVPQKVTLRPVLRRTRLRVNVDPNVGASSWLVRIQKKQGARYRTVKNVRTRAVVEVVTVDVGRGRYRAVVPAQFGYATKGTPPVRIRR